jgi:hypothetical protein
VEVDGVPAESVAETLAASRQHSASKVAIVLECGADEKPNLAVRVEGGAVFWRIEDEDFST